jgi:hypothetical protein
MGVGGPKNREDKNPNVLARNGIRTIQIEVHHFNDGAFTVLFTMHKEPGRDGGLSSYLPTSIKSIRLPNFGPSNIK